jgi:hypothetical protein
MCLIFFTILKPIDSGWEKLQNKIIMFKNQLLIKTLKLV